MKFKLGVKSVDLQKKDCNMFGRDNAEYNHGNQRNPLHIVDPNYPDSDAIHVAPLCCQSQRFNKDKK